MKQLRKTVTTQRETKLITQHSQSRLRKMNEYAVISHTKATVSQVQKYRMFSIL